MPGGGGRGCVGIPAHATLAVSESGRVLGLLGIDAGFRTPVTEARRGGGDVPERAGGESRRWLDGLDRAAAAGDATTRVIPVGDREADMWALYARQAGCRDRAGFVVRASRGSSRSVIVDGRRVELFEAMAAVPPVARDMSL